MNTCAVMSTGLRGVQNESISFRRLCAASGIGATTSPCAAASSAIITPAPPEMVINPTRRLEGRAPKLAAYAASSISSVLSVRTMPACASIEPKTASAPVSAAVCERTASAPGSERPVLVKNTRLPRARAASSEASRASPSPIPSA